MEESPAGTDVELTEAIQIMLQASGFETNDVEVLKMVECALRSKLERIAANAHLAGGQEHENELTMKPLKEALNGEKIRIDRPIFILEQPQSKMSTRRSKNSK